MLFEHAEHASYPVPLLLSLGSQLAEAFVTIIAICRR
jgi:hypothetical protein